MQPVAPPSLDYVPGPKHPSSLDYVPGPEHPPSPVEIPYVPKPEYHEYLAPSDDEEPFKDEEDDEEEEEYLSPANSFVVPIVDPIRLRKARKTVRLEPSMTDIPEADVPPQKSPLLDLRSGEFCSWCYKASRPTESDLRRYRVKEAMYAREAWAGSKDKTLGRIKILKARDLEPQEGPAENVMRTGAGMPVAPSSLDYVPGPKHPPSLDYVSGPEHPPSPVEIPYVPKPEYHEYLAPSNDEIRLRKARKTVRLEPSMTNIPEADVPPRKSPLLDLRSGEFRSWCYKASRPTESDLRRYRVEQADHRRTAMLLDIEAMYAREACAGSKDKSATIAAHVRTLGAQVATLIAQTSSLQT
nr:hypothetical protein [Tanacetum cinerariifolium]